MDLTTPKVYQKYMEMDNRIIVLCVKLMKVMYDCLRIKIIFYKYLLVIISKLGFTVNTHNTCVTNNTVNEKELNIVWNDDDLKLSHVDLEEATKILSWTEGKYGKMRIKRDKSTITSIYNWTKTPQN